MTVSSRNRCHSHASFFPVSEASVLELQSWLYLLRLYLWFDTSSGQGKSEAGVFGSGESETSLEQKIHGNFDQ